tara:strand:- start:1863 stop:3110 length:1248 start_codon:yes stop_codon:yes gene_type:complete
MYARGSDNNTEFSKGLNSFFRGIVINDRDPNEMQRVQIFIPELTNLDYNNEIDGDRTVEFGAPHSVGDLTPGLHKHLIEILPWAEQAAGLFGERGLSHYKGKANSQVSKATYVGKKTESKPPNSKTGGGMPRQQMANKDNSGAGSSIDNFAGKNPTAAGYMPMNSGPMASGIYGVPQVGAHLWVFFDRGDINFPVYFASIPSYAESAQVFQNGGYPGNFSTYDPQGANNNSPAGPRGSASNFEEFSPDATYDGDLLAEGSTSRVDPNKLYAYTRDRVADSSLNGFVPEDGAKYGIKKGTPDEWARYFTNLAKLESSYKTTTVGDQGRFVGNSNGLFQLSPNDATNYKFQSNPYTISELRDPEFNTNQAIKIHEHWMDRDGIISGRSSTGKPLGAARYWGPLRAGKAWDRKIGNLS